jgi:ABC-type antimicrobial peptide transport system permease subunit
VAVVNATFAKRLLGNASPIGRRVDFAWDTKGLQTVVGVIADIKEQRLNEAPAPAIYIPLAQRPMSAMYLVVRTAAEPSSIVASIRRAVRAADPNLPLSDVRLLGDVVTAGLATQRLGMSLLSAFSVVAVILAAIGLYGVISYSVVQRTQELGVRAALGAGRGNLIGLVLRQGALFLGLGLALGAIVARSGANLLSSQLFGVAPDSVVIYAAVAVLLSAIALLAMAVPAVRASRADPLVALRSD